MGRHAKKTEETKRAAADAQALNVLAKGGRSFFWASHFLGRKTAYNAAHLYQFCRILDDLADGDIANGPARLAAIQTQLERLAKGKAVAETDPALAVFLPVMKACRVPIMPLLHLLEGLLFDQGEVAIAWDDPEIGIDWPVREPTLSERDRNAEPLGRLHRPIGRVPTAGRFCRHRSRRAPGQTAGPRAG